MNCIVVLIVNGHMDADEHRDANITIPKCKTGSPASSDNCLAGMSADHGNPWTIRQQNLKNLKCEESVAVKAAKDRHQ